LEEFEKEVKRWVSGEEKDNPPPEILLYQLGELDKTPALDMPHILLQCLLTVRQVVHMQKVYDEANRRLAEEYDRIKRAGT
jgi:hypothetical protein